MTILACAAGKDVYVEKPLTHTLREGEWMLRAATEQRRVVQSGTQQRSGRHYQRCRELVRSGHLGDVRSVRMAAHRNILPGFSQPVGDKPLSAADWDMWLGPAPRPTTRRCALTALKEDGFEQVRDQFVPHVRNFLDCVKSRAVPASDLESSHRTAIPCHLANIAMKVGRVLRWDAAKGDVVGDAEASKLLTKEYRSPWDRELKGALPHA